LGVVVVSASAGATVARLRDEPGVAFADSGDLTPTKAALRAGILVKVCNTTTRPLAARLLLTDFAFTQAAKEGAETVATASVVTVTPEQVPLPAGGCKDVKVRAADVPFAAPSYDGFLTVVTDGGGLARRKLTVLGTAAAVRVRATGAVDTIDLHGSHRWPHWLHGTVRLASGTIALTYDGVPPVLPKNTPLGTAAHGTEVLTIYSNGKAERESDHILAIPVRVEGKSEQGVFKGTLDPNIAGSVDKPVAVTVTVSDNLWAPTLVLLLGLALAVCAKLASGLLIPRLRWHNARKDLEKKYRDAAVPEKYQGRYAPPGTATVAAYLAKSCQAVRRYARGTLLLDPKSDAYTKIDANLASALSDVEVLAGTGEDSLADALDALDARSAAFADYLANYFPDSPTPLLARKAAGLLHLPPGQSAPTELPVGGATNLVAKATDAVALMDAWTGWADELRRYSAWVGTLAAAVDEDDAARLSDVAARLVEVHFELLDADDQAQVVRMRTAEELRTAYQTLARLSGRYGVYVPTDWDDVETDPIVQLMANAAIGDAAAGAMPDFAGAQLVTPIAPVVEALVHELGDVAVSGLEWALELIVLLVSGGLALVISFHSLVAGKAFGSLADYLAILALGVGAELVGSSILGALSRWRTPVPAA
jgi:hypothetical protein